jgi:hypothetical protein
MLKRNFFFLAIFLSTKIISFGQVNNQITTAVPFLLFPPDARHSGTGDAGVASTSNDANNFYNPSQQIFSQYDFASSFNYTPWHRTLMPGINLWYFSGYYKINNKHLINSSLRYFSIENYNTGFDPFTSREYAFDAGYIYKIKSNHSAGLNFKYIFSQLVPHNYYPQYRHGKSLAGDLSYYGFKSQISESFPVKFSWGVNISNVGSKISYFQNTTGGDFLPMNLRAGIAFKNTSLNNVGWQILFDANKLLTPTFPEYLKDDQGNVILGSNNQPVIIRGKSPNRSVINSIFTSFNDALGGFKEELQEIQIGTGIELDFRQNIFFRLGYSYQSEYKSNLTYFTTGVGARFKGAGADFSYLIPVKQRNPFENTLRLSLNFNMNIKEAVSSE